MPENDCPKRSLMNCWNLYLIISKICIKGTEKTNYKKKMTWFLTLTAHATGKLMRDKNCKIKLMC